MRPRGRPAQRTSLRSTGRRDRSAGPALLSPKQFTTLLRGAARELTWALPAVTRETQAWRARAAVTPDAAIRRDALEALGRKRGHSDGAALFCILTPNRNGDLLRLLVAYETIWDFLDSANEHGAASGQRNGRQLHQALIDAADPVRSIPNYYRHHPWEEDGGYLRTLVEHCRDVSARFPSYGAVRAQVVKEAIRAQVLAINHDLDPTCRDTDLRAWAARQRPVALDVEWFELSGAASASLTIHALFALANSPTCNACDVALVCRAYFPWISAATTMLDSYVDQAEDRANGDHSYIAHYPSTDIARRVRSLIRRSFHEASLLPDAERHTLIVACMLAMYLSKATHTPLADRASFVHAGGTLTRTLLPIFRLWRIAYDQRST